MRRRSRAGDGPVPRSKRLTDVALASVGLCLALPLLAVISAAVACERKGPILFRQVRVGQYGHPFFILKFRTMEVHAERHTGPVWATARDPRATRVGAFLRRSHLDELPQLINVLRGEMSLVGPRPERPVFVRRLRRSIPGYMERCRVLPGITGLAQIRNGYDVSIHSVRRKLRYDLLYIERKSVRVDLMLLVLTVRYLIAPLLGRVRRAERRAPTPGAVRLRPTLRGIGPARGASGGAR